MKTRKELADILKAGIEEGDTDTVWFVIGELEREGDPVTQIIANRKIAYMTALDEAQNDVPLDGDEYYESDSYYEGAINALTGVLKEIEGESK